MTLRLKIGPAVIEIRAARPPEDESRPNCAPFAYAGEEPPALTLRVRTDAPPRRRNAPLIAESARQWQLSAQGGGWRLEVLEQVRFEPKQVALINRAFDRADVHILPLPNRSADGRNGGWFLAELMSPLLQWWLTGRLAARAEGMILHGSAVALGNVALAFVGPSGAGKTTIARWCRDAVQAAVLNDERIVVWRREGQWYVGGTPWHGEMWDVSAGRAPLAGLFVLKKAETNRFTRLSSIRCFREMIREAFLPIWSREAMEGLMAAATRLAGEVPVGELQFVNDPSIAGFLDELLGVSAEAMSAQVV